jgi:outer membrane lipoprotein SlyB
MSAHRFRPASWRRHPSLVAAGALSVAIAASTLTACGPRDQAPLAGGADAVAAQTATAGQPVPLAPLAAPGPAPVGVAGAQPTQPGQYAAPAQPVAAATPTYPIDPPQVQPAPAVRPAPAAQPVPNTQSGSVASIEPIRERPQGTGTGAVIGGVLGAVVGNQFGHGAGRAAMTGVGAAGGAIAGNNVERNYRTAVVGYRVNVRLDNGHTRTFQRTSIGDLHVGDRVRVDANSFSRA